MSPDEKFLKKVSTTKKFNVNNSMDIDLNNVEICSLTMTKMTNEMYKDIFLKNNRRMMPVVEAGMLVGIVSRQDILKALVQ